MFEGLRKKFSNFIGGLTKKETEEVAQAQKEEELVEVKQEPQEVAVEKEAPKEETSEAPKEEEPKEEKKEVKEVPMTEEALLAEIAKQESNQAPIYEKIEAEKRNEQKKPRSAFAPAIGKGGTSTMTHGVRYSAGDVVKPTPSKQERQTPPAPPPPQPKVTFTTKLKSVIFRQVKIGEKDADPFIESLKIDLLQSDVNYDVTDKIAASIRSGLVGKSVDSRNIEGEITETIRSSIMNVLSSSPEVDIVSAVNQKKERGELPYKIMFIGPNGAGKTTTMAKIASMLLSNNITCVLSASDTFRAAAIEQTVIHAGRLGINVIKGNYGSDPSSVAFDAIAHAKAHGIMAVLIDSAGRQETNKSLIEELKKMARVTAPDLKIFVGEAISGNALLDQVKAINEAVKVDGIILTKLDVDAKGGNTISILSDTTVPILYFGTGEKYTDIMRYDPKFIIDNILPSAKNN